MNKLYFIAELGQNHQGDINIAKKMVDALVGTGVRAIKTAKRDIDTCLTEEQKNMIYDNEHSFGRTYYEHRKALELSLEQFHELKNYVENKGFDFISSFTDIQSFQFLNAIKIKKLKVASQRITDTILLEKVAHYFAGEIFMSSGMSDLKHVDHMVSIFKNNKKYLLQCSSIYPCPEKQLNLRVLKAYRKRYKNLVDGFGFSGHNMSIAPDIAAYALGATIIERHFTLDRKMKGTDHAGSLEIHHIKKLIKYLKQVGKCLGNSDKHILKEELPSIKKLRGDLK